MNFDIYINEMLRPLGLPFYEKCMHTRGRVNWMDDGALYHISKLVEKFRDEVGLNALIDRLSHRI